MHPLSSVSSIHSSPLANPRTGFAAFSYILISRTVLLHEFIIMNSLFSLISCYANLRDDVHFIAFQRLQQSVQYGAKFIGYTS